MQMLITGVLVGRGGVQMAECILDRTKNTVPPPDNDDIPPWYKCRNCRPMNTPEEDVCCGRHSCITSYRHFYNICLDQQVLTVAIHQRSDIRADPIEYSSESCRKAAYRQYILWIYKKLGRGNRRVCPSCVVLAICHWYPSPTGQYMGFRHN